MIPAEIQTKVNEIKEKARNNRIGPELDIPSEVAALMESGSPRMDSLLDCSFPVGDEGMILYQIVCKNWLRASEEFPGHEWFEHIALIARGHAEVPLEGLRMAAELFGITEEMEARHWMDENGVHHIITPFTED